MLGSVVREGAVSACRSCCSAVGEPLAGSAGVVAAWVGLAWPKPLWDAENVLSSQGLPKALAELAQAYGHTGGRLALRLFQRTARPSTERVELVLWRPGTPGRRRSDVPLAEVAPLVARFLVGGDLDLDPMGPELFVCTDGKHDPCCAQFGRAVYEALEVALQETAAPVRVAQCSHIGGHRFAANCLSLPDGRLYGRLLPGDARALLEAVRAGRPLRSHLRGTLGRDPVEEVAEAFLGQHCGAGGWQIDGPGQLVDGELRVPGRIHGAHGEQRVVVRLVTQVYSGPISCGETAVDTERWVARAIDPA
jgi:hypothetical protein